MLRFATVAGCVETFLLAWGANVLSSTEVTQKKQLFTFAGSGRTATGTSIQELQYKECTSVSAVFRLNYQCSGDCPAEYELAAVIHIKMDAL